VELNPYPRLAGLAKAFADKVNHRGGRDVHCEVYGGVFTVFFTDKAKLRSLQDVMTCDTERFAAYFQHIARRGFYLSPSQFELEFISAAHSAAEVEAAAEAAVEFLAAQ